MELQNSNTNLKVDFESREENLHFEGVFDIEPRELHEKLNQVVLVDVRQAEEYQGDLGHIPNSILIALDELPERIDQLPRNQTIVFVCRSGTRSARAASFAKEMGIDDVYNLKGGMILWNELKYATEGND